MKMRAGGVAVMTLDMSGSNEFTFYINIISSKNASLHSLAIHQDVDSIAGNLHMVIKSIDTVHVVIA